MLYRAFISYSHANEKTARWLMRRLESYRVPANLVGRKGRDGPIPARLGKFFRDRDELPSAGNLSKTINDALEKSHALIVICSPASAQSQWVNAEIDAFRQSGHEDNIFSFIVAGDPASREPGVAAFPYALLKPNVEGEPEREPLAADARKDGDGRDRAFIKLVAGLLGVGFDDLAQREAQQRHKRMAIITGASLAGMTLAVVLAVTAYVARNDAERRQAQAEDIIGFMLGDLRKNLTKVGRLDLMRSVDDKATGYFSTLDPRDLSDRALEEQARSLTGIGEVRVNEGNHKEAMIAFREAHARSTALYDRAPENGQRLFDLAQAEYWIGYVAWQQSRYDDAKIWLEKYRDSGIKLAAMDRNNFDWQKEAAYGYGNLAVLDQALGNYDSAKQQMLMVNALYIDWLQQRPDDLVLRFEYSDNVSWLGTNAMLQGDLREAEKNFLVLVKTTQELKSIEPKNMRWKEDNTNSLLLLVDNQIKLGKFVEATKNNNKALAVAQELAIHDSSNIGWINLLGVAKFRDAQLVKERRLESINEAIPLLKKAHEGSPKDQRIAIWLARGLMLKIELLLSASQLEEAHKLIQQSAQLIYPFWQAEPNENNQYYMAQIYILEGEALMAKGQSEQANSLWLKSYNLLLDKKGSELPFDRLEYLARVLLLLNRPDDAKNYMMRLENAGFVPLKSYP